MINLKVSSFGELDLKQQRYFAGDEVARVDKKGRPFKLALPLKTRSVDGTSSDHEIELVAVGSCRRPPITSTALGVRAIHGEIHWNDSAAVETLRFNTPKQRCLIPSRH